MKKRIKILIPVTVIGVLLVAQIAYTQWIRPAGKQKTSEVSVNPFNVPALPALPQADDAKNQTVPPSLEVSTAPSDEYYEHMKSNIDDLDEKLENNRAESQAQTQKDIQSSHKDFAATLNAAVPQHVKANCTSNYIGSTFYTNCN
jgi:hypothetical protein